MKYYLSPSILSADFAHLGDDIAATEKGGTQYLHYDVMDWYVCSEHFLWYAGSEICP